MLSSRKRRQVKLSRRESELFNLLPADDRKLSTSEIVTAYYGDDRTYHPINARQIITDRLSTIQAKLEVIGSEFRLSKSGRRGPAPIEYWLSKPSQQ